MAMAAYEQDRQLRDKLDDGLAEELGYAPEKLDTNEIETLTGYGTL